MISLVTYRFAQLLNPLSKSYEFYEPINCRPRL
jgi:hypothetical protein